MSFDILKSSDVLQDVMDERLRQERKFPNQELPDGTSAGWRFMRQVTTSHVDRAAADGTLTWFDVLEEEFFEAASEDADAAALRLELIQVAAVAVRWIEAIDRREAYKRSAA